MINNHLSLVPELKVDRERYDNRTASYNGHFSLARAAGLRKYGYGNGFTVMDPISGTILDLEMEFLILFVLQPKCKGTKGASL